MASIYIDPKLHEEFKKVAFEQGKEMKELASELVANYLKNYKKRKA